MTQDSHIPSTFIQVRMCPINVMLHAAFTAPVPASLSCVVIGHHHIDSAGILLMPATLQPA